jgi:hypothetical protein
MADSPKEAEAAQALFCSIADYLGNSKSQTELVVSKYPSYELFKKGNEKLISDAFAKTDMPSISLKQIEEFLINDNTWYISSINIAKNLIKEITTISNKFKKVQSPNWKDIIYVRGAAKQKGRNANAMENIAALFDRANKNENNYFGDINKWSPADIYFVSATGDKRIQEEVAMAYGKMKDSYDFLNLNKLVSNLLDEGNLLPVSLKKAERNVSIVEVNFERSKEEEYLSDIEYFGVSDWSKKYTRQKPITRDIKIYFSKDKKEKIKIRHDPYSSNYGVNKAVKCEIEVTGAGGRGGSVVGIPLISQIMGEVDKGFAQKLKMAFESGIREYAKELDKANKKFGTKPGTKLKSPLKEQYDDERAILSGLYVSNAIMPLFYNWFTNNEKSQNTAGLNQKAIQKFIEYTSSRTIKSGKFVIAKG